MSIKEDIQYALNSLLDETDTKKSELAEHLGVSRAAVSNWTSGQNSIDMELVPSICDFFNVSIDEFFGRSAPKRMSAEEEKLLALYHSFNDRGKARLLEEALMMANSGLFAKSEDHRVSKTA